jgi:outer membrane protein assembly factor BamB
MSQRTHPARMVLAVVGFLASAQVLPAWAQEKEEDPTPAVPSLRADAALARQLAAARDQLRAESWAEATHLLQALADSPEDALVCVQHAGTDGREIACWTGIRAEAARLLGTLPPGGREFYEARYGPRARALLAEARQEADLHGVAEVARRYAHTAAGAEATPLLGAYHLDRGRYNLAACCFARLLESRGVEDQAPATLFRAALAFRRAGAADRARLAWDHIATTSPRGVHLGDRTVSLSDLKRELDRVDVPAAAVVAPAADDLPSLEPRWSQRTADESNPRTWGWLQSAVQRQDATDRSGLPGALPVVVGDRLIFRTFGGLHAVDARTFAEAWDSPSAWSLERLAPHAQHGAYLQGWVTAYLDVSPHVLYENALLGTLSTDGARVYAVDDLAVPPYRTFHRVGGRWHQEPPWPDFNPELNEAAAHNQLLALDAASGRAVWQAGGRGDDPQAGDLGDSYFLGAPLPLDGHLYVLTEKHGEVALACLRPADGMPVWKQPLASAPTRLLLDPGRRVQAARPVHGNGILVCPTNAGLVLGIDLLTHDLAWAYPYRTEALTQSTPAFRGRPSPPRVVAEWKAPLLSLQDDTVVFTAPDEGSVHCVGLRDGRPLWRVDREEDDLYVAGVVAGKVLVVGKQACRALDLADGKQLWRRETGLPSGRGVAAGNVYYLPLKGITDEKGPTLCTIDVERGVVRQRSLAPGKEAPGNLLLWQGGVVSQTATGVTAYPGR